MTAITGSRVFWFRSFYVWMSVGFVLAAFAGFIPTYWARLAAGTLKVNPIVHIHGLVWSAWTLLFLLPSSLVPTGRTKRHRALGMVGISLATAMSVLGPLVALNALKTAEAAGAGLLAEAVIIVPLSSILAFSILVASAMANIGRPEIHKRLMVLSAIIVLDAPFARLMRPSVAFIFTCLQAGPPSIWIPLLLSFAAADLFLIAALAYDWQTRGRPHLVYLVGGAAIVAVQYLRVPIAQTSVWHSVARAFLGLLGSFPAAHA
jgi:hypothetical protein